MIDYPIAPVDFCHVALADHFWLPRLETNRTVTIPSVLHKCEEFGRIDNFRRAAGRLGGSYVGTMPFEDTDVYKAIEGASYSLAQQRDPQLEAHVDALVELIAAAQEPDGYLYTNRTIDPYNVLPFAGPSRWSNLAMSHELYNSGHLYEAACAHYLATGKRALLDVALRNAALVRSVFNPNGRHDVCGHQIVEMGLAKLYRITQDRSLLEMARFFLEERGRHESRPLYSYADNPGYSQDHVPVREQCEAVGHAVRAAYMYCGMADIAALLPDEGYASAITAIWRDVVGSKVYLTGGIGARHKGEAFGSPFELPNVTAYAETCAGIGSVLWNHRLFLLTGGSESVDMLEQTLYNNVLSGVSLRGDEFFYVNPLESDGAFRFNHGSAGRQPWFEVSCCPTSLCRFLPSIPGLVYAVRGSTVYVNLFMTSRGKVDVDGVGVGLIQKTDYPWDGEIRITVHPERPVRMRLMIRLPSWSHGQIMGGSLYRFEEPSGETPMLRLNRAEVSAPTDGYAEVQRDWADGDCVEISLPMPVRKVIADERVEDCRGKSALMRGPIVYCVEGRDADESLADLSLGKNGLVTVHEPAFLGGVVTVRGPRFTAIPYCRWANRGAGPMKVWLRNL